MAAGEVETWGTGHSSLCAQVNTGDMTGRGRAKGDTAECAHYFGVFTRICDKMTPLGISR